MTKLPVIDMSPLYSLSDEAAVAEVVKDIGTSCRTSGFFYVTGHGVSDELLTDLEAVSRAFFKLPEKTKLQIDMKHGGPAWRGYFPVGGELTSGRPDLKQGLYFGTELADDDPRVMANLPLHGRNQWPKELPELESLVLKYMASTAQAAQVLLRGIALSLGLDGNYFLNHYTQDPTVLFRIFHYPAGSADSWGVGEHTDYGLLTLLAQDQYGGLQVKSEGEWIAAPPVAGAMICNIGDMLDRLTGGWYRSTPHRVRNLSGHERLSFPLFFDPDFDAQMQALPNVANQPNMKGVLRWDEADLHGFVGSYGEYLLNKVGKVFPSLSKQVTN